MKKILILGLVLFLFNIFIVDAFNYTYSPSNLSLDLQKPLKLPLNINILDNPNVSISWYIDGEFKETISKYKLDSILYDNYQTITITANMTDGIDTNLTSWDITILPPNVQLIGSLPITLFILLLTIGVFILPFLIQFKGEIMNLVFKRSCFIIGIFLVMMDASILANISEASGLNLNQEMFFFMWVFSNVGYLAVIYLTIKTPIEALQMNKQRKKEDQLKKWWNDEE